MPASPFRPVPVLALSGALFAIGGAALAAKPAPGPSTGPEVIRARCLQCHSAGKMGGLDLRTRAAALTGGHGGPALVPGKPDGSRLYTFAAGKGPMKMPPAGLIPAAEQKILRDWIAAGAEWSGEHARTETWWSLRPLKRPAPPAVKNKAWVRSPIDAFVLASLEAKGLAPAPPAGRRELIRRVYFDLTGLPPTPEAVQRFERDPSPDAYERLVDELLASPRYGERWARFWLDLARFAESQGFERDKIRDHAWRYRDYVIKAFNADKPYNQFVREQIAGSAGPDPDREGVVASSFLVAGPWDEVGATQISTVMKKRVREDELEDMIAATGQTFLGLTVNCARCHDHKFDPIPARDYYRMQAAFAGVRHGDRDIATAAERAERDKKVAALKEKAAALQVQLAAVNRAGYERAVAAGASAGSGPAGPAPALAWNFNGPSESLPVKLAGGATVAEGRLKLNGTDGRATSEPLPFTVGEKTLEAWVRLSNLDQRGGSVITLEDLQGNVFDAVVFGEREPKRWLAGSNSYRRTAEAGAPDETAAPEQPVHFAVTYAADGRITLYRDGKPYGNSYVPASGDGASPQRFEKEKARIVFGLRHSAAATPGGNRWLKGEIDEARLYTQSLSAAEVEASFRRGPTGVTEAQVLEAMTPEERTQRDRLNAELTAARDEQARVGAPELAYSGKSDVPTPTHILARGDVEQPGEAVTAGGLSAIPGFSGDLGLAADAPEGERRKKLADWIVDPRNPLTPRVMVNRVWQRHFGRGIVGTPSDFGINGEAPSHPELLDYLASVFSGPASDGGSGLGWSIKRLHRMILLSNTYRQSDAFNAKAVALDADNRLIWRMTPRRLEAEEVRDAMLSVSGKLNLKMGGPGYRTFRVEESNAHFYIQEDRVGPDYERRSIYRMVVNSGQLPLLEALDCPDPSVKTPRRAVTTTPLQALALLNNSFVLRQAKETAARLEREAPKEPWRQIDRAYSLALGRTPTMPERTRALEFVRAHGMAAFCRVLLNSSEFAYVR